MSTWVANSLNGITTLGGIALDGYGIYVAVQSDTVGYFSVWLWGIGTTSGIAGLLGFAKTNVPLAIFFILHILTFSASVAGAIVFRMSPEAILRDMNPPPAVEAFLYEHSVYASNVLIAISVLNFMSILANIHKLRTRQRLQEKERQAIQWR